MSETDNPLSNLIAQVQKAGETDIYVYAGPVSLGAEREFNDCLRKHRSRKNLLCLATTFGGSADVAYQIVRSARRHYPEGRFSFYVDSICKSAGTLMAIGADEIIMSDTAELGPLDVQIQKPDELGEYTSGLTSSQALETLRDALFQAFEFHFLNLRFRSQHQITTKMAAELAVKLSVGSFEPIYGQFDPMRVGENERSCQIAMAYCERIKTDNVKDDAIMQLIRGYPSHGFVIDRDEASELFHSVRCPTESELMLSHVLRKSCEQALTLDSPVIRPLKTEGEITHEQDDSQYDSEVEAESPATDADCQEEDHSIKNNTGDTGSASAPKSGIAN